MGKVRHGGHEGNGGNGGGGGGGGAMGLIIGGLFPEASQQINRPLGLSPSVLVAVQSRDWLDLYSGAIEQQFGGGKEEEEEEEE